MILQTIADLKTTDGSTVTNGFANVLGYWNVNDGGGGEFYWDSISTEDDNTGTIFEVSGVITGRWKRLFSGVVNVKWFGVVNGLDFSKGLQNRLNLQKALDLSKVLGGMAINFSKGDYVLDVAVPLNIPSHTTLSGIVGKSMIHIDPATIVNMSTRPYPLTNSSVFFSTDDGNQPLWSNGTSVKNITINGISMTCDYTRGSLPTGYDLKGITILAGTNINITNCNFNNIPQTGIYVNNCNTWKITNNTAIGCGFGHATAPATNNGISTAGQGVSTDLTQQCTSGAISNNICNYNRDEGIQFGFTRGVVITSNVCIGNGDLGIEGDTTYNSSSTEASLGIEIPSQAVISNNYVDGLKQDGTYGKGGIGFAGGNEGIVIISNNLIKNLTGKPAIAANQISGGKCLIDGNFIDRVDPDATQHQISINIEDVTVTNNRFARQGNSNHHADIYIAGTVISADVRNNNSDGNYNFISLYTYQAGLDGILKNINICDNQCKKSISSTVSIRTDLDQAIDIINIERNQFYNLNSSHASNQYGVILTQKVTNDVTINSLHIVDNIFTYDENATTYPIGLINFDTANAVSQCYIFNNDFSTPILPFGLYQSVSSLIPFNVNGFLDKDNKMPSQMLLSMNSAPTSGSFTAGDKIYTKGNHTVQGYICTSTGSPGVWKPFGLISADLDKLTSGITASRPTVTTIGYIYFDTTLGHPVWWNGTAWIDAEPMASASIAGLVKKSAALTHSVPAETTVTSPAATAIYTQADVQKMVDDITNLSAQMNSLQARYEELITNMQTSNQLS